MKISHNIISLKRRATLIEKGECVVPTVKGQSLVFESYEVNPNGTSYVRFVDANENEILFYNEQEWVEEPQIVMGCIMAAIQHGVKERFDFV